ncbi:unnamed protein product [Phytophthora lilii]|uniref:Unnamed protein product n=1 Tax=Phytophthora lilii TaxID=2077276 RepID=A0A9W6WXL7_9STRA|nr:unnamed protein product [Phytophthora lilii]
MTKEEIQEAIERHQNGGGTSAAAPAAPPAAQPAQQQQLATAAPMMMTAAAPMQMMQRRARYPAYVRVLWTVSSLVGAASILTFLWNYAVQSGYIPWLRPMPPLLEAAKLQKEKEEEAKKDEALLAELSSVSSAIQQQTAELAKLSSSLDEKERDLQSKTLLTAQISSSLAEQGNAQSIAELKAEISTLKALLVSKKSEGSNDATATKNEGNGETKEQSSSSSGSKVAVTTLTSVNPQQPPVVVREVVSKAERMEKALKMLRTEHHEELLKSIGFETTGLNMEWKWHTASKATGAFDENIAILRALLKALQSLSCPKASSDLSLEEIAHASLEKFFADQDKKKQEEGSTSTITTTTTTVTTSSEEKRSALPSSKSLFSSSSSAPAAPASTSLDAFMARLEQQTSISNISNGDISVAKALSSSTSSTNVAAPTAIAADEEEKMPVPVASSIAPTVTAGGPSYPESFKEVMDLIQKGEPVPGIREIEDKLSVDSSSLLAEQMKAGEAAAAKPWEKVKA